VAKVGKSNPDRTISLKMLQFVVENKHKKHAVIACSILSISTNRGMFVTANFALIMVCVL
jgi:hypothetical protein